MNTVVDWVVLPKCQSKNFLKIHEYRILALCLVLTILKVRRDFMAFKQRKWITVKWFTVADFLRSRSNIYYYRGKRSKESTEAHVPTSWYGQRHTHAHNYIARTLLGIVSCFAPLKAHQLGKVNTVSHLRSQTLPFTAEADAQACFNRQLHTKHVVASTNINHKEPQRTANQYAEERRIYKDLRAVSRKSW